MDALHKWVPVIKNRIHTGGGKDRSLETLAWNELLHSSGNILHAITQRVSSSEFDRIKVSISLVPFARGRELESAKSLRRYNKRKSISHTGKSVRSGSWRNLL